MRKLFCLATLSKSPDFLSDSWHSYLHVLTGSLKLNQSDYWVFVCISYQDPFPLIVQSGQMASDHFSMMEVIVPKSKPRNLAEVDSAPRIQLLSFYKLYTSLHDQMKNNKCNLILSFSHAERSFFYINFNVSLPCQHKTM